MGSNKHGQLGIGEPIEFKNSPVLIEGIPGNRRVNQITCGGNQTLAVLENGEVYAWGQGAFGATGLSKLQDCFKPEKITFNAEQKITKVSAGLNHSAFIDVSG